MIETLKMPSGHERTVNPQIVRGRTDIETYAYFEIMQTMGGGLGQICQVGLVTPAPLWASGRERLRHCSGVD